MAEKQCNLIKNGGGTITGSITTTHTLLSSFNYVVRNGNVAQLSMYMTLASNVTQYATLATIPKEFAPISDIMLTLENVAKRIYIEPSGKIVADSAMSSGQNLTLNACYICNG